MTLDDCHDTGVDYTCLIIFIINVNTSKKKMYVLDDDIGNNIVSGMLPINYDTSRLRFSHAPHVEVDSACPHSSNAPAHHIRLFHRMPKILLPMLGTCCSLL